MGANCYPASALAPRASSDRSGRSGEVHGGLWNARPRRGVHTTLCPARVRGRREGGLKTLKVQNRELDLDLKRSLGQERREPLRASLSRATACKKQVPTGLTPATRLRGEGKPSRLGQGDECDVQGEELGAPSHPASTLGNSKISVNFLQKSHSGSRKEATSPF